MSFEVKIKRRTLTKHIRFADLETQSCEYVFRSDAFRRDLSDYGLSMCSAPDISNFIGFHCQSASVLMAEPFCNGRNVDSTLNTGRCEKVPQVVMNNPFDPKLGASRVNCF